MKKIMFFRPLYYMGGTEIAILNLVKRLKGFDIYIGYSDETSDKQLLKRFKKYATVVNINNVKDFEIDTFVGCSAHYHLVEATKNIKRHKTILWIHHLVNLQNSILTDEKASETLDHIITVSKTVLKELKQSFPGLSHKMKTIYNVVNDKEIKKLSKIPKEITLSNELNLVSVCRVCKEKGFDRMLYLAKYLKELGVNFKWFIVGDNYYKDEFERIFKTFEAYQDNFEWMGFYDNPHHIVKQCDYSVLLSDYETWGLVLTEAMLVGVPCIATDFETVYEQIEDGKNGIILSRKNVDSYKDRILDIVSNKDKFKKAVARFKYENNEILNEWTTTLMDKEIKFSIIVPNYNKGQYIEECLNSVINQTYKNYELIVIDDGSTDNSLEVISKFDVNLYKTERLQAGGARNLGLSKCTGDYIIFLDSDDYLTDKYVLERLSNTISGEDLIFLNYTRDSFGNIKEVKEKKEDISIKIEKTKNLGCPTKCFKKTLLEGVTFPECKRYEDIIFTLETMCKAKNYTYFEESFFTYRRVPNSNANSEIEIDTMIHIFEELFKIYELCLKYPKYSINLLNRIKKDRLKVRLDVMNKLIETGENTFKECF